MVRRFKNLRAFCHQFHFIVFLIEPLEGLHRTIANNMIPFYIHDPTQEIWSADGDHGKKWNQGTVTLGARSNFKVAFKGVKNYKYHWKYVGLDDISFVDCQAPQELAPGECHFESGLCGWKDEQVYDDFDWILHKGLHYVFDKRTNSFSVHRIKK